MRPERPAALNPQDFVGKVLVCKKPITETISYNKDPNVRREILLPQGIYSISYRKYPYFYIFTKKESGEIYNITEETFRHKIYRLIVNKEARDYFFDGKPKKKRASRIKKRGKVPIKESQTIAENQKEQNLNENTSPL